MHACIGSIIPIWLLWSPPPAISPFQLHIFFFFFKNTSYWIQLVLAVWTKVWGHPLEHGQPTLVTHTYPKSGSPFLSHRQLGFPGLYWDFDGLDLVYTTTSRCECMGAMAVPSLRGSISKHSSHLPALAFIHSTCFLNDPYFLDGREVPT